MHARPDPEAFSCLPLVLATMGSVVLLFSLLCTGVMTVLGSSLATGG
ncbi:MAG: hypothetical protein AAGA48_19475 [Myxococcota bacterium]